MAREARAPAALALEAGAPLAVAPGSPRALLVLDPQRGWRAARPLGEPLATLAALYLPVCGAGPGRGVTVGHLGQSLDGFVATACGDSAFVSDRRNIVHLHRMRALCDAVVVGGATVRDDDPRLTTRHAEGTSPLRVVLDPRLALSPAVRIFRDGAAATLLACTRDGLAAYTARTGARPEHAELLAVDGDAHGHPDLAQLLAGLAARGCHAVFVEGGGITVSRFLQAGLLDRLQIAVAPLLIGDGRPGIRLPPRAALADCLRPAHRVFRMGRDVLFDLDLRAPAAGAGAGGEVELSRVR